MPRGVYKREITRKGLIRELDRLVGEIVKLRDKKCVCCGTKNNLTPGHLFTRQVYATRWNLQNVFAQCASCNFKHEHDSYPLTNYYLKTFGKRSYDNLHFLFSNKVSNKVSNKGTSPKPIKTWQLKILKDNLNMKLEKLKTIS